MKVFVVICHDRHVDDDITVHSTRESADRRLKEFQDIYEGYEWRNRNYGRAHGWLRYVESHDDGPNARIQEMELQS